VDAPFLGSGSGNRDRGPRLQRSTSGMRFDTLSDGEGEGEGEGEGKENRGMGRHGEGGLGEVGRMWYV